MRNSRSILLTVFVISYFGLCQLYANNRNATNHKNALFNWEMEIHMCQGTGLDNWGSAVSLDLYRVLATGSGGNNFLLEYQTSASCSDGSVAKIEMINTASNTYCDDNIFSCRLGADGTSAYVIVLNGSHFMYFTTGSISDWSFYYRYNNGVYSITQNAGDRDSEMLNSTIEWNPRTLSISNSFSDGNIKVDGFTTASGSSFTVLNNSTHTAERVDRQTATISGSQYVQVFQNWNGVPTATESTYPIVMSLDRSVSATFKKEFNINFYPASGASVCINNTYYSGSFSYPVLEGNQISISTPNYVENSLEKSCTGWYSGSTNYSTSFTNTPTDHKSFYWLGSNIVKPVNGYRNQSYGTTVGQPITITWNEHPSSLVTGYEVWRSIKDVQSARKIADISSRSDTTYTDNECLYTSSYTDNLIRYDVKAKLSNGVTSDNDFIAVYGDYTGGDPNIIADKKDIAKSISLTPTEYSLGSYPNPFNPTTVIRYTMPEAGQVSLKVYNILSQEVANLVESNQSAGVHQVNFNASHLPTGIYIARLQAGAKVMTAKLQLVK